MRSYIIFFAFLFFISCTSDIPDESLFVEAASNGATANEGFVRCERYLHGWLNLADPVSGLVPQTIENLYWNAKDAAADNYPFMVLTASMIDRSMFTGTMLDMLNTEIRLTSRLDRLPDTYDFVKQDFLDSLPDMSRIIFGSSEYVKDGLLPITEWLGYSPWSVRMMGILDDIWKYAPVETPYGKIVSESVEVNGEMLQTLSRIYWMTGEEKYLDWALRMGDYFLLGNHHPTRDMTKLRLRDHGCEIISGLCELYVTVNYVMPDKKEKYSKPIHEMLDRILEVGRNEHGLFYNSINPISGEILDKGVADTWGYTYNGFYSIYLIDGTKEYRQATLKALSSIDSNYRNFDWEHGSSDGYADAIESALNLYNREQVTSAADWINSQIRVMWAMQKPNGIIDDVYADGNFARTTLMYCLWKTGGTTIRPWRKDVYFGSVQYKNGLLMNIRAENDWEGKLFFDIPRHKENMHLPIDWPRINQFPEWFTVEHEKVYAVSDFSNGTEKHFKASELHEGLIMDLKSGEEVHLFIRPL